MPAYNRDASARATAWRSSAPTPFSIGYAALLVVDARRLLDAWLSVAALSFEAAAADPVVLDPRIHSARPPAGPVGRRRAHARAAGRPGGAHARARAAGDPGPVPVPRPTPGRRRRTRRAARARGDRLPRAQLRRRERADRRRRGHRPAQRQPPRGAAGQRHRRPAHRAGVFSRADRRPRVSTLLDTGLTGLPPFLARHPGPESGALVLEYTAHAAVAEVRSLVTPVAAQTVSVSRGVESHSSLAPIAARRAHETLRALRVAVATELVVAVRALRVAGQEPVGAGTRAAVGAGGRAPGRGPPRPAAAS